MLRFSPIIGLLAWGAAASAQLDADMVARVKALPPGGARLCTDLIRDRLLLELAQAFGDHAEWEAI